MKGQIIDHLVVRNGNYTLLELKTVPRWKDSELSGSAWRYSVAIFVEGEEWKSQWYSTMEEAMLRVGTLLYQSFYEDPSIVKDRIVMWQGTYKGETVFHGNLTEEQVERDKIQYLWQIWFHVANDYQHRKGTLDFTHANVKGKCEQEGCALPYTHVLQLKQNYCCECATPDKDKNWHVMRYFCDDHVRRGDQNIEDCDANYTEIK